MEDKNLYGNLKDNYVNLKTIMDNCDDDFVKVILQTTIDNYTDAMEWIREKLCPIYPVRNYEYIISKP